MSERHPKGTIKCCGNGQNCSLRAISPFHTEFEKKNVLKTSKIALLFAKKFKGTHFDVSYQKSSL